MDAGIVSWNDRKPRSTLPPACAPLAGQLSCLLPLEGLSCCAHPIPSAAWCDSLDQQGAERSSPYRRLRLPSLSGGFPSAHEIMPAENPESGAEAAPDETVARASIDLEISAMRSYSLFHLNFKRVTGLEPATFSLGS